MPPAMIGGLHISLESLRHNAGLLRDLVGAPRAAFVVKGNAYGHGLLPVARAVEPFAARLCVYAPEEALALRDGGIEAPLLLVGPAPSATLSTMVAARVELALWDAGAFAQDLAGQARRHGERARVHVKVNTDLNRLGIEPDDLVGVLGRLLAMPEIEIAGIYSHLAAAEELDSPYTMHQLAAFERALANAKPLLDARGVRPLRHIAASAAAMLWPQTRLDMVRFGIALYGLWPSPQTRDALGTSAIALRPALAYHSQIIVTRSVAAGASIGYGASFHAPHGMRIGVIPAGYADGVPRALSNRGAFAVDGARCPIVGRVAMNMTEIDLTAAPNAHVGSPVDLLNPHGKAAITADDWAAWSQTINYEIVTRLPEHLRRDYLE